MRKRHRLAGRAVLALVCTALCVSCATSRQVARVAGVARTVRLEYKSVEDLEERFGYIGSWTVSLAPEPGEQLAAEPTYLSDRPLYGKLKLGDGEDNAHVLVWDESEGTGSGYDTFYIDANNNGDLTDDPSRRQTRAESGDSGNTGIGFITIGDAVRR